MWCLGTWFSGGHGSARLMVGLDHLKGLFQPKRFYDSVFFPVVLIVSEHCFRKEWALGTAITNVGNIPPIWWRIKQQASSQVWGSSVVHNESRMDRVCTSAALGPSPATYNHGNLFKMMVSKCSARAWIIGPETKLTSRWTSQPNVIHY